MKSANRIDVVYFDFSKTFDHVDHRLLTRKLAKLLMPYLLFKTVMNFIMNRTYAIKVDGKAQKEVFTASSSIPQGSHCGPLLYIVMCLDIIDCAKNTVVNLLQYADDTKFYKKCNHDNDRNSLQIAIDNLSIKAQKR